MLARILRKIRYRLAQRWFAPAIAVTRTPGLVTLGSRYGGWTFEPSADLYDSVVVSCGLGEDASFDIEFATRFRAKIVLVDPTPRAISHFAMIKAHLGESARQGYGRGGRLPVAAYDLRQISPQSLCLEPSALWIENTTLKFFAPPDPDHVSHSISNYQNNYSQQTAHIAVAAITPLALFEKYGLKTPPLMKLDIEGAEIEVLRFMLAKAIFPRQLLVELDELNAPSALSKRRAEEADGLLRQAGYECRFFDGQANFLYVRQ